MKHVDPTSISDLADALLEESEHPSPEDLLAYRSGNLEIDVAHQVREHLAWCSACSDTVLDLASWPDVDLRDPDKKRDFSEEAEDWQMIQHLLRRTQEKGSPGLTTRIEDLAGYRVPERPNQERSSTQIGASYALAAIFLLAVVGLSLMLAMPHSEQSVEEEVQATQANLFVMDLKPLDGTTTTRSQSDGSGPTPAIVVPSGMETLVFLLTSTDPRSFDDYAVEFRDTSGKVYWQRTGLVSPPEGGFSVAASIAALPSEVVELWLFGVTDAKRELLATYRVRLEL